MAYSYWGWVDTTPVADLGQHKWRDWNSVLSGRPEFE